MNKNLNQSRNLAYLRQLCCSGLPKETVMPEFLRAVQQVLPSSSNTCCDVSKRFAPTEFYLGYDLNIPDLCAINEGYWTLPRILIFASWFTKFPIFTDPRVIDESFYTSDLYGEVYLKLGQHHMMNAPATYLGKPVAMITLYRPSNKSAFKQDEQTLFLRLMPYVAHAVTITKPQDTSYCAYGNTGMMVMDSQGTIKYQSREAKLLLELASFPSITPNVPQQKAALLTKLAALCRNLNTIFRSHDAAPPSLCHINGRGRFLFRAQWLDSLATEPDSLIGMTIEHQEPLLLKILRGLRNLPISPVQLEVAALVAQGFTNEEIGRRLHIKLTTVKDHIRKIFDKLDIHSRDELLPLLMAKADAPIVYH